MTALTSERVLEMAMSNPINLELARRLTELDIPECMLTAGCLFQAVWNQRVGRPAGWGVKDYDVIYFDQDLSWEAEDRVIDQVQQACGDLNANIEVRNQARVHLWYQHKFGRSYPQLQSVTDGVDRYLVTATCLGMEIATGRLYASYGLAELEAGLLRINPLNHQPDLFRQKALSYQERWPWLRRVEGGA